MDNPTKSMTRGRLLAGVILALLGCSFAGGEQIRDIYFSTCQPAQVGELNFSESEVVIYTPDPEKIRRFIGDPLAPDNENIDALHILYNGNVVFSTRSTIVLNGIVFGPGELIELDQVSGFARALFGRGWFPPNANIDAVFVHDDGRIVLSVEHTTTFADQEIHPADIIEYDPATGKIKFLLAGSMFGNPQANVDALHILRDGRIILSTDKPQQLSGFDFGPAVLLEYDPATRTARELLSDNIFISSEKDIDALYVEPEQTVRARASGTENKEITYGSQSGSDGIMSSFWGETPRPQTVDTYPISSGFSNISNIPENIPEPNTPDPLPNVVPEPITVGLLLSGTGLWYIKHKRRIKKIRQQIKYYQTHSPRNNRPTLKINTITIIAPGSEPNTAD